MSYSSEVLADSPLGYWRLGEASGTTMVDSSGNSRNGTYTGSPTLSTTGLLTGDSDTAATFGAANQYGLVAYGSWMLASAITIEAIIKTSTTTAIHSIAERDWGGPRAFQFRVDTNKVQFITIGGGAGVVISASPGNVADGVAHHVAATYDGTNIKLYVDGSLVTTTSAVGALSTGASALSVAANGSGGGASQIFSGVIDEVAYYGTALSGARIAAHAAAMTSSGSVSVPTAALALAAPAPSVVVAPPTASLLLDAPDPTVASPLVDAPTATLLLNAPDPAVIVAAPSAALLLAAPAPLVLGVSVPVPTAALVLAAPDPIVPDAAESYTSSSVDVDGPITVSLDTAESSTGTSTDVDGPIDFDVEQIDAYAEAWATAYDTLEVALDPDTLRPQYRLKVVDRDGDVVCELADAQIGTATRSLNGVGGLDFSLGKNDEQLASVPQFAEVQLWRGSHLVPGGWFTVVDPQIDEGGDTFDYQCAGLTYYLERATIGKERPELIQNGGFEEGARYWGFSYSPGSNAETPPRWEIVSDAREGGKALRIFAEDKVQSVKRTVESAAVFVPNQATFLSGGEQAIRNQVSDIPNGTAITVEGHTADSDGGTGYALSVARAEAAAAVIHAYKPTLVITTVGKGETEPVDPRHTEAAYRKNRRVVIVANIVQTKQGHRQFGGQALTFVNDTGETLEIDVQAECRVDEYDAPSKDGRMLYADVRLASAPNVPLNDGECRVDEYTPVGRWLGQATTVKVPAGGQPYRVNVRLFPTAGSATFDLVSAKPNFKLTYTQTDPRHVIGGLVEHAQDPAFGKGDFNIQPYGPLSGFKMDASWEWKAHKPVQEAISEVVSTLNGPDANIAVTPRRRLLVIHPKQGRSNGFVLAAGDCAGDARILSYAAGIDGDQVATTAIVQASWSGGGGSEVWASEPRTDGLVLERVYTSEQDTPTSTLLEQARTAAKYGHSDVVTRVIMHPDDTTLLMEQVTIGDIVTVAIKDGRVDVNEEYRITQIDLDPNADQLSYTLALEV